MAKKLKILTFILAFLAFGLFLSGHNSAMAADCNNPTTDSSCICTSHACDNGKTAKNPVDCASGKVDSHDASKCATLGNDCAETTKADECLKQTPIVTNLNNIIKFMSAGIGIVVIAVIIIGGIQYTLAGDNASAITAAKQRIINGLIALVAFIFMFALLQWLIPGGL